MQYPKVIETVTSSPTQPLPDGLYSQKNKGRLLWFYVERGILHFSTDIVPPLLMLTSGVPIVCVQATKRTNMFFVRAKDVAEMMPEHASVISECAASKGLTV